MLKCSSERCVWAPQSLSAGTSTTPRLSVSFRVAVMSSLLGLISPRPEHRHHDDRGIAMLDDPATNRRIQEATTPTATPTTVSTRRRMGCCQAFIRACGGDDHDD